MYSDFFQRHDIAGLLQKLAVNTIHLINRYVFNYSNQAYFHKYNIKWLLSEISELIVGFDPFKIEVNIPIQDDQIFIDESN